MRELTAVEKQTVKAEMGGGIVYAVVGVIALLVVIFIAPKILYQVDKSIVIDANDTTWGPVMNDTRASAASNIGMLNLVPLMVIVGIVIASLLTYMYFRS